MDHSQPDTQTPEIERWYRQLGRVAFHFGTIEHCTYRVLRTLSDESEWVEARKLMLKDRLEEIKRRLKAWEQRHAPSGRSLAVELSVVRRTKALAKRRNDILHSSVVGDGPAGEGVYTIALLRKDPPRRIAFDELKAFADEVKSISEDWLLGFRGLAPADGG